MSLEELLEELRENILRDVSDAVRADPNDQLLSNKSLVRYINDGEVQFAKATLCLRDETTPDVCHIQLVDGQVEYDLDPRVLSLFGARVGNSHLKRTTYAAMTNQRGQGVTFNPPMESWHHSLGGPVLCYTDRETSKLGVYPAPSAEYIESTGGLLVLRVARKPLFPLVSTNLGAEPEIPSEYHLDILEWAAWRALRNHDADIENMAKASAHKKRFEDATKELEAQAKRLLMQEIQFGVSTNWS